MIDLDFKNPDYRGVIADRVSRLQRIRRPGSNIIPGIFEYYRENPIEFIEDWGFTFDPRNIERGLPALVPFILFGKQREWLQFILDHWKASEGTLSEKSRDSGLTWLAISLACTLCLFNDGMVVGFGSRKRDLVDQIGNPDSIFHKGRIFLANLPSEFRRGWTLKDAPEMRIKIPQTGSVIIGEAGDDIGRGGRTSLHFVDEAAHLSHPDLIDASLSQTTNSRHDISTPNGLGNPFERKRHSGKIQVFTLRWKDDPRKDVIWYQREVERIANPVIVAQELDIDYTASVEGVIIPHAWVMSAVDAHLALNLEPTGAKWGALDIADEGQDKNAFAGSYGFLLDVLDEWSGKGSDIFETVERAFLFCDENGYERFRYDADGLGAGARGDARIINERRYQAGQPELNVEAYRGSENPFDPEKEDVKGRKNKDLYKNRKSQAWWQMRLRFQKVHRWRTEGTECSPNDIISISSKLKLHSQLANELSQSTWSLDNAGKIVVDKQPDGTKSPNLGDAVVMRFATGTPSRAERWARTWG